MTPEQNDTVTVDTGQATDVFVGARLVWMCVPRGGYGFAMPVDAVVISHGRRPSTSVRIEVMKRDGSKVRRNVQATNLRWSRNGATP